MRRIMIEGGRAAPLSPIWAVSEDWRMLGSSLQSFCLFYRRL